MSEGMCSEEGQVHGASLPEDITGCLECNPGQLLIHLTVPKLFLCEDCNVALCLHCSLHDAHTHHTVKSFPAASQETKNIVLGLLAAANSKIKMLDDILLATTKQISSASTNRPGLRRAVSHAPAGISPRRHVSIGQESYSEQDTSMRESANYLKLTCSEIETLMRDGGVQDILKLRRIIGSPQFLQIDIPPLQYSNMKSAKGAKLSRTSSTGHTSQNSHRDVVCAITNGLGKDGTITTIPGKEVKLRLFFWSRDVRSRPPLAEHVTCKLEPSDNLTDQLAAVPKIRLRQIRTDTFEVSFCVEKESVHRLVIALAGQPVNGSPYTVVVRCPEVREEVLRESLFSPCASVMGQVKTPSGRSLSPRSSASISQRKNSNRLADTEEDDLFVARIGTAGRDLGGFLNPQGICVVEGKCIAVTDSNIGCIQVFSLDGVFLKRFGERGRKAGQVLRPTGIALLPKCHNRWDMDLFVVADYENRTVVLFDMDGNSLISFGSAKLTGPKGVAVALNGDIIVVDNRSNSLFIFRSLKLYKKVWAPSSSAAHLAGPHYVAVSPESGDIIVSDFHHHTIKVFDDQYHYRWSFGSFNSDAGMGSFSGPTGVAVDQRGIAVADWGSGRIQVFDSSGSFLAYVTALSSPLFGPQGLAISQDGSIFVCDSGNHTVRVYRHPLL